MFNSKEYHSKENHLQDDTEQSGAARRIVFLDDHVVFRNGLKESCIRPFFENIELLEFANGDIALEFVKNDIQMGGKIDLIITDINHPGAKGNDIAMEIRNYEALYQSKYRIPIFIISLVESSCFPDLFSKNIIDHYISKASNETIIVHFLREFL